MKVVAGLVLALLLTLPFAAGCASQNGLALSRAAPCPGGAWVTARRGPTGRWQPGHWLCPQ
jgi:hypothetical protein